MADVYGSLPAFSHGQVLSATHLNAIQSYVQSLRDDFLGVAMPFSAAPGGGGDWNGILRHKYNLFDYKYVILEGGGFACIEINTPTGWVAVPNSSRHYPGTYSASGIDISSLNLVRNAFYEIRLRIDYESWVAGKVEAYLLRETRAPSYLAMSSFADGIIPTAAHWNALCTYAADIAASAVSPQPLAFMTDRFGEGLGKIWPHMCGTINHRGRYLAFGLHLRRSWSSDESHMRWTEFCLHIGAGHGAGTLVLRRRLGDDTGGYAGETYDFACEQGDTKVFTGLLDLDVYPGDLVMGADYDFWLNVNCASGAGNTADAGLLYLYEVPAANPVLTGWTPFVPWQHGLYVRGNTGSPQITTIPTNLNVLYAATAYHNYPSVLDAGFGLYGIRRWRWLHYRTVNADETGTLTYTYAGKEKKVSLSDASAQWLALDLDSVQGLYPGIPYTLTGVKYALEDVED
jgi:hypothetical protein